MIIKDLGRGVSFEMVQRYMRGVSSQDSLKFCNKTYYSLTLIYYLFSSIHEQIPAMRKVIPEISGRSPQKIPAQMLISAFGIPTTSPAPINNTPEINGRSTAIYRESR